ncbi:hypothetical protein EP51_42930 (plasmid) [Rhodococcus opacus]|uniref:Uncharacterized protein n=1 Tax=Rhodococcus opacus TaxID=37919 RepID=A0A076EY81_RHOOP|nr:hypothetical protein EP51_42930 [Rhodococcus opacus]
MRSSGQHSIQDVIQRTSGTDRLAGAAPIFQERSEVSPTVASAILIDRLSHLCQRRKDQVVDAEHRNRAAADGSGNVGVSACVNSAAKGGGRASVHDV